MSILNATAYLLFETEIVQFKTEISNKGNSKMKKLNTILLACLALTTNFASADTLQCKYDLSKFDLPTGHSIQAIMATVDLDKFDTNRGFAVELGNPVLDLKKKFTPNFYLVNLCFSIFPYINIWFKKHIYHCLGAIRSCLF